MSSPATRLQPLRSAKRRSRCCGAARAVRGASWCIVVRVLAAEDGGCWLDELEMEVVTGFLSHWEPQKRIVHYYKRILVDDLGVPICRNTQTAVIKYYLVLW